MADVPLEYLEWLSKQADARYMDLAPLAARVLKIRHRKRPTPKPLPAPVVDALLDDDDWDW